MGARDGAGRQDGAPTVAHDPGAQTRPDDHHRYARDRDRRHGATRRWPRRLLASGVTLGLAWVAGGGWYFAQQLTAFEEPLSWREEIDLRDIALAACRNDDARLDLIALQVGTDADPSDTTGRYATFGTRTTPRSIRKACAETTVDGFDEAIIDGTNELTTVVLDDARTLLGSDTALLDINAFLDPEQAGLPHEDVTITTPAGDAPAWLVPGDGPADTWVVIVHGRGNTRAEGLRLARVLHELGHTSLLISYRNDGVGPETDDARGRFGTTEWRDLDAAITFARTQAPHRLAVAGLSQGGGVVASWLAQSGRSDLVDGLLLDSPLLDLGPTLRQQAANRGIPTPLAIPLLAGTRAWSRLLHDFDPADVDHVEDADDWPDVPTLLLHGTADTTVPVGPSDELAARLGDRVTYLRLPNVEHVRAANANPAAFAAAVTAWVGDASR